MSALRNRLAATSLAALGGAACYSPQLYQMPRTLAPKHVALAIAAEPTNPLRATAEGPEFKQKYVIPAFALHIRLGLGKDLELALGTNFAHSQLGLKWSGYQSEYFDIAILGQMQAGWLAKDGEYMGRACNDTELGGYCKAKFHLEPSIVGLFGFNPWKRTTWVLSPGFVQSLAPHQRPGFRVGLGFQWRISEHVALHPEVTYVPRPLGFEAENGGWFGGLALIIRGADGYAK